MKIFIRIFGFVFFLLLAACTPKERTIILLSTNDMHAKIQHFPQLAAAVQACRDTAQVVVLVDAGDRWTGNAYVDRAPVPGMPMIAMMNKLGYDVATLGNHEFDQGQAFLGRMLDSMDFEVVCANVVSDTCTFPQMPPYTILERDGIKIGFVGVVTNYEGAGHPAGNASSFTGLTFPDPQQMAAKYGVELRDKCDVLVLVSHMGDDRDAEFLLTNTDYDEIIGGHTHVVRDTVINGTLLTQTKKELANVGVTTIRMKGRKIESVDYRLIPLAGYVADAEYQQLVDAAYADSELTRVVGSLKESADKTGLANLMAEVVADETDAEVGFYHIGGVRLDRLPEGSVCVADIYELEPFTTRVATMRMTPEDMRRMILSQYNDTINKKESHRLDLISTTPYTIITQKEDAVDVKFPKLIEGERYNVAVSDYVFRNYKNLNYIDGVITDLKVTDLLFDELRDERPLEIDNRPRQMILKR